MNAGHVAMWEMRLSYRIACFFEDYDPYGFRDSLEVGVTVDQGIMDATKEIFGTIWSDGDFASVREWLDECDVSDYLDLKAEKEGCLEELGRLEKLHSKLISKNQSKIKRRR